MSRPGPTAALLILMLLLLLLPIGSAAGQEPAWEERFYNPAAAPDDLVLPMPCGGSMVFRKVSTPVSADLLDDLQVKLGQANQETGYSEYIRREYIAGSLNTRALGLRDAFFYIGKYEVTQDQYAAVMMDACPQPGMGGRRPVTEIAWFDAVAFSRAYTEWLYQNAPDSLPAEGDTRAFLRLPTEAEWEYAARGGAAVSDQQFLQRLFPMDGDITQYVWFQGPRSAGGRLRPVGLLKPNPLGLYDVIGNAEEFVLEPYRMNRAGRDHGQVGGFITRGGSYQTPEGQLRSAMRIEYNYFDDTTGRALALDTFGFRLLVSAPVAVSLARTTELREAWQEAARFSIDTEDFNPLDALNQLAADATEIELQQTLEEIAARFREELASRGEIEARALRRAISAGAVLIRMLRQDHRLIEATRTAYDFQVQREPDAQRTRDLQTRLDNMRERFDNTERAYFDILVQAADDYPAAQHRRQRDTEIQSLRAGGLDDLVRFAELFTDQALTYQRTQDLDRNAFMGEILQE